MSKQERDLFEQNDTIDQYCIECSLTIKSKNHIYKAFIPNNPKKEYFCIKAYPYDTQKHIEAVTREQNIIDKFLGQPFILPIIKSIPYNIHAEVVNEQGEVEEKDLNFVCHVTRFCENLDLRDVYNQKIKNAPYEIGMKLKKIIFYQSLRILECLHEDKIVHHDIKLNNFLVKEFRLPSTIELMLIDFEFANDLSETPKIKRLCGTYLYMAPEIYTKKEHDFSADIWSLAVMIYFIYNDKFPFGINKTDRPQVILHKILSYFPEFEADLPSELEDLLFSMLQKNPETRITAKEALKSPFFDDVRNLEPAAITETKQMMESSILVEAGNASQVEGDPDDGQFYTEI